MTWWPGWDSIEGAGWWSGFYFWFGIAALFVLGITEVISHRYGLRKDELVAIAESSGIQERTAKDAQHEAEATALRQEVAAANQKAAEAAQKASSVEAKQAPRHLTNAQRQALIDALKPFGGQAVDVVVPMGDNEAHSLAGEFVAVFRAAGWTTGANDGISQAVYSGTPVRGVQVTINEQDARANKLPRGVEQLVQTLIGLRLTKMAFMNPQTASGKIEFRVGSKEL